jgi:cell division protein FtsI (penicillin-binding protein 3)
MRRGDRTEQPQPPVRVLKPETAITMRQMMEGVVLHGTGSKARLEGYTSGGKTGSAQIFDTAIGHFTHSYNASFMGFAPVTNPAIVVVVTLNGTHGSSGFGGAVAAPVFRIVATEALRVLDVPKDLPDAPPAKTQVASNKEDVNDLAISDLSENPNVLDDEDDAAKTLVAGAMGPQSPGPKVPNFQGKSMRAVLAEAAEMGVTVLPDGSGVARLQTPPPGSPLRQGERIKVVFAR